MCVNTVGPVRRFRVNMRVTVQTRSATRDLMLIQQTKCSLQLAPTGPTSYLSTPPRVLRWAAGNRIRFLRNGVVLAFNLILFANGLLMCFSARYPSFIKGKGIICSKTSTSNLPFNFTNGNNKQTPKFVNKSDKTDNAWLPNGTQFWKNSYWLIEDWLSKVKSKLKSIIVSEVQL